MANDPNPPTPAPGDPLATPPVSGAVKAQSSAVPLLIISGVLLVWTVFLSWQMLIVNTRPIDEWANRSVTGLIFFWVITLMAITVGIIQIGSRRRYLNATTPAERVVLDAQAKRERRLQPRKGNTIGQKRGDPKNPTEPPQNL